MLTCFLFSHVSFILPSPVSELGEGVVSPSIPLEKPIPLHWTQHTQWRKCKACFVWSEITCLPPLHFNKMHYTASHIIFTHWWDRLTSISLTSIRNEKLNWCQCEHSQTIRLFSYQCCSDASYRSSCLLTPVCASHVIINFIILYRLSIHYYDYYEFFQETAEWSLKKLVFLKTCSYFCTF